MVPQSMTWNREHYLWNREYCLQNILQFKIPPLITNHDKPTQKIKDTLNNSPKEGSHKKLPSYYKMVCDTYEKM